MTLVDMLAVISRPRLLSLVQGAGRWPGTFTFSRAGENSARVQEREPLVGVWSQSGDQRRSEEVSRGTAHLVPATLVSDGATLRHLAEPPANNQSGAGDEEQCWVW